MSIHDTFVEKTSLAKTYAEDGAFRTAADRLRSLANDLIAHADWCDGLLEDAINTGTGAAMLTAEGGQRVQLNDCPNSVTGGQDFPDEPHIHKGP